MKKYLSVLALAVRSSVYKITGVLVLMGSMQLISFCLVLKQAASREFSFLKLEEAIERGGIPVIFSAALLMITGILIREGSLRNGSGTRLTLNRLRIGRKRIFLLWTGYHSLCYLILMGVQLFLVLVMNGIWERAAADIRQGEELSSLSLYLAFYRSGFLHSLLPMAEGRRWICNGLLLLMWGMITACFLGYMDWKGRNLQRMLLLGAFWLNMLLFSRETGDIVGDLFMMLAAAVSILIIALSVKGEKDVEEMQ